MQKEYICDGVCKYTLSSGKEFTLSENEIEELAEVIQLFDDLNGVIEELESDIIEYKLNEKARDEEIASLEREVERLENKFFELDTNHKNVKEKIHQLYIMLNKYGLNDIFIKEFKEFSEDL